MRSILVLSSLAALTGCASASTFVHSDTTLGRVVIYRNGIAYFERTARIEGDTLSLAVPQDKVDDFLKSLTVVDAHTGQPAPIAYPTTAPGSESGLVSMKINLTGAAPHELRLTYVTESPAWKPSYRVVLGKGGKVSVQALAIVDNTSGEDWQNVQLGVGSSSALSFRFDLRSVRLVQRETLRSNDLFAQAPPMGGSSYVQADGTGRGAPAHVMAEFNDDVISAGMAANSVSDYKANASKKTSPVASAPKAGGYGQVQGHASSGGGPGRKFSPMDQPAYAPPQAPPAQATQKLEEMARALKGSGNQVVIEGYADTNDHDKNAASLERANRAREQLIRAGVDPNRVVAQGNGEQAGRAAGVRIVEAPPQVPNEKPTDKPQSTEPIGTSHFESTARMTVARGTSAMVSILQTDTAGEVVYFYDAESARGNANFPFRAVRLKNPTDSALESGPVTVFGDGRFVGEGLTEPIPAHSVAFVPFALDRQIVIEKKDSEVDRISRIITVQRGVFSTEVQHAKRTTLTLTNRLDERAVVYIRHTVAEGYQLVKPPEDRLGNAYLFRTEIPAGGKTEVTIEETTPLFKSTDIRSSGGMDMVVAYLSAAAEGRLKTAVNELLKLNKEMADIEQHIATAREQMGEYRARMDELHAQIVTLKLVKTAGPLMQSLEKKLQEMSDKLSKATIDLVALQEKLMVARIRFQDGVADLSIEKKDEPKVVAEKPR